MSASQIEARLLPGLVGWAAAAMVSDPAASVYAREKGCCAYCGARVPRPLATYDYVVPRSQGGQTTWENIVIYCTPCNQRKGGRTSERAGMHLRVQPVKPRSLPETLRLTFLLDKNAPPSWRQFFASYAYWNAELENDTGG